MRRLAALAIPAALGCATPVVDPTPATVPAARVAQSSGTQALLQAVSVVSPSVVWVSGHRGTYARTTNGGTTWRSGVVPGADTLQWRDVHGVSADTAFLLSAGNGDLSRIYKTHDGGATWAQQFVNRDSAAFFDCFAFWDSRRGIAFSDAVDGAFVILVTTDGATWHRVPDAALPAAQPGEGSFAASGTCVDARPGGHAWIGTGNAATARVLRTADYGRSWTAVPVPIAGGEASGLASVIFRDARNGLAAGGPIGRPDDSTLVVARTSDGGRTWSPAGWPGFTGAVYGSAWVPGARTPTVVAVGPRGASVSRDGGATWAVIDTTSYWAVGAASPDAVWLVGPGGRIVRTSVR
ncbi:MAG TPA: hypothetical protein VK922_09580 [Gemmatimonadaceae bacterium]|nr:hypothetical protein [Gemmatimonadaceae bacterium]